jgi:hypothetical protein
MLCEEGLKLFRTFEQTVQERSGVRYHEGAETETGVDEQTESHSVDRTKTFYHQAFLAWVSHRTFCL